MQGLRLLQAPDSAILQPLVGPDRVACEHAAVAHFIDLLEPQGFEPGKELFLGLFHPLQGSDGALDRPRRLLALKNLLGPSGKARPPARACRAAGGAAATRPPGRARGARSSARSSPSLGGRDWCR